MAAAWRGAHDQFVITLAVCVVTAMALGCIAGSLVPARRKGALSVDRVGLTILLAVAALGFVVVLIWVFYLSQIHIG